MLTADGLVIDAQWFEQAQGEDVSSWVTLNASPFAESAEGTEPEDATVARIEEINARVGGWAYRVPDYKFDNVTKRLDDLLDDVEPSEEAGESS